MRLSASSQACRARSSSVGSAESREEVQARGCANTGADSAMSGLPELRFATTDAPASKRWRQLERVGRPGSSDENRQGSRLPVRAAKNWRRKQKSRRPCCGDCGFRRRTSTGFQTRSRFLRDGSVYRREQARQINFPNP